MHGTHDERRVSKRNYCCWWGRKEAVQIACLYSKFLAPPLNLLLKWNFPIFLLANDELSTKSLVIQVDAPIKSWMQWFFIFFLIFHWQFSYTLYHHILSSRTIYFSFYSLEVFMSNKKMTPEDARRIQSSQDKKGDSGDKGFVSRSSKSASQNSKSSNNNKK